MADQWYVARNNKKHGPFSAAKLKELAAQGRLFPTDMLLREGMQKWVAASSVKGLFSTGAASPAGPSPLPKPGKPSAAPSPGRNAATNPTEQGKSLTSPQGKVDRVGSYVFGSLLFLFFVGVFVFAPSTLPEFKQRMLAISSALLAGIFALFMSGSLGIQITGVKSPFGKVALRASGGTGVFALVLVWWLSPLAPVKPTLELKPIQFFPNANQISVLDKDVKQIDYSFDGENWRSAEGLRINETGFKDMDHAMARIPEDVLRKHNRVFIKYVTQKGQESNAKEFTYDTAKAASLGKPINPKNDSKLADALDAAQWMTQKKLDWHGKEVSEDDFKKLKKATALRELDLSKATFSESHLNMIPFGVQRLNLANTKLTDDGFKVMGLRPRLEELNLSGTQVTDAALESIGRNPSWRSLRIIDLSNTKVTDEGLTHLSQSLLLRPKAIVLTGANVTAKGVEVIRSKWGKSCAITY